MSMLCPTGVVKVAGGAANITDSRRVEHAGIKN